MIVTSLEAALLILTIEFGLLAVAIVLFLYRGARSSEAETASDATELVSKVSTTEESRRAALETVFKDKYQFEGDELVAVVEEFMQREKAFYNAVVGAFLGRGNKKIADLNDELTKVVAPWISMTPKKMLDAEAAQSLVAEKSELETELANTKQVLERMMSEYNRAFRIESTGHPAAGLDEIEDLGIEPTTAPAGDELPSAAVDQEMEELGDIDVDLLSADAGAGSQDSDGVSAQDPALVSEMIEDPDPEPAADPVVETPVGRVEKPMTADDLDDLMDSLGSEPMDDPKTATAA